MPQRIASFVLNLEPILLVIMVAAFWYPDERRVATLLLAVPPFLARYVLYRRLITRTPLDGWFALFLFLGVINVVIAPFTRGLVVLGRPLMGMILFYSMVDYARRKESVTGAVHMLTLLALLMGGLALSATQWNEKSRQLAFIIDLLPVMRSISPEPPWGFPGAERGFNANEIAGALSWLAPFMVGLALYRWRIRLPHIGVIAAFIMLFGAVFLGQSRFALAGIFIAIALLIWVLLPASHLRTVTWGVLAGFIILEVLIFANVFNVQASTAFARDASSASTRIEIWSAGLAMVRDYPFTGVGMAMFRSCAVREVYPVPGYVCGGQVLPHAHNELLQVAADLGFPGLVVFIGWHVVVGRMLWLVWRQGAEADKSLSAALAGALGAHTFFGLGDAITLWDRFTFIYWLILGMCGALYTVSFLGSIKRNGEYK